MNILIAVLFLCVAMVSGWPGLPVPETDQEPRSRTPLPNCGLSKPRTYDQVKIFIPIRPDAVQGEFPWQVSLQKKGFSGLIHICGGAILNSKFIITAAHCVVGGAASSFQVMVGGHDLKRPNQYQRNHAVSRVKVHDLYDGKTIANDIAILELSSPIDFAAGNGYMNGVCLPSARSHATGNATVSGWNVLSGSSSTVLQFLDLLIVPQSTCRQSYGSSLILDHMLCAGPIQGGRDFCQGHSGGPLIQRVDGKGVLVGLVSWGYGCSRPNYPGVYTRVSHFIDWIQKNTQ